MEVWNDGIMELWDYENVRGEMQLWIFNVQGSRHGESWHPLHVSHISFDDFW